MNRTILIGYTVSLVLFTIFSYAFIDPGFFYLHSIYSGFAWNYRLLTTIIYILFISIFFGFYLYVLKFLAQKKLEWNSLKQLIVITIVLLIFSYPTILSYDIFNY